MLNLLKSELRLIAKKKEEVLAVRKVFQKMN